jgi:DNA repair protein RadC
LLEFGFPRALLAAACNRFKKTRGLGNAKYAQLNAGLEMAKRHLEESIERGVPLTSPAQYLDYLVTHLRNYPRESIRLPASR